MDKLYKEHMREGIVNSMILKDNEVFVKFGMFRAGRNIMEVVREMLVSNKFMQPNKTELRNM